MSRTCNLPNRKKNVLFFGGGAYDQSRDRIHSSAQSEYRGPIFFILVCKYKSVLLYITVCMVGLPREAKLNMNVDSSDTTLATRDDELAALRIQCAWSRNLRRRVSSVWKEHMTCSVCLDVSSSIFRCNQGGHPICTECLIDLWHHRCVDCPVCRSSRGFARDHVSAHALGEMGLYLQCDACQKHVPFAEYDEHRTLCTVGQTVCVCPMYECDFRGTVVSLIEHLRHHQVREDTGVHIMHRVSGGDSLHAFLASNQHVMIVRDGRYIVNLRFVIRANIAGSVAMGTDSLLRYDNAYIEVYAQSVPASTIVIEHVNVDSLDDVVEEHMIHASHRSSIVARLTCRHECSTPISALDATPDTVAFFRQHVRGKDVRRIAPTPFHRDRDETHSCAVVKISV